MKASRAMQDGNQDLRTAGKAKLHLSRCIGLWALLLTFVALRSRTILYSCSFCLIVSWFCNFVIGIPHHNIMDKREELRIPEDLTVREGRYIMEDTSSCCAVFFTFACCWERSGCASSSRAFGFGNSLVLYRSFALISFDLLSLLPVRLYYIVSSCIQHCS